MEILSQLNKTVGKPLRRVGRGIGSKKGGHTTGRGAKGDKVRGKTRITFDGTKIKKGWIKRLPFLRGKHRLTPTSIETNFDFDQLEKWFKAGESVDRETLSKKSKLKIVDMNREIKILSSGKLTKALNFKGLKFSESARKKIIALGGKIES